MITKWTQNIKDPEEKVEFERYLLGSKRAFARAIEILKEEDARVEASERSITDFDTPNWAYKQAYKNGYRAAMAVVEKLLNLDQQKGIN